MSPFAQPAQPDDERTSPPRIKGFDGLRALAFLLVFLSHKSDLAHRDSYGDVGVWIFFALSGFLITRILASARSELEARRTTRGRALARFYLRRSARIFPVYYALLVLCSIAARYVDLGRFFGTSEQIAYWFYATNILVAARGAWLGHFGHLWSLAVEEQFYLVLAPLILSVTRRRTIWVCLGFVAVGILTRAALELAGASAISSDVNSLCNFGLLGLGGVAGLLAHRSAPAWLTSGLAQALVLTACVAAAALFGGYVASWYLYAKVIGLLAALLVFQIFQNQGTWFVALLHSKLLLRVGMVSYGAYLFHPLIDLERLRPVLARIGVEPSASRPLQLAIELGLTLAVAGVSWNFFERPIVRYVARYASRSDGSTERSVSDSRRTRSQVYARE